MRLNHAENGSGKPRIRALAKGATFRPVGFQDRCIQPLCHPSTATTKGYRSARGLHTSFMDQGVSQADIARELGVSRQAVQKMLAC
jgi:hypothetical protein